MTSAVRDILKAADALSSDECADLADELIARMGRRTDPEIRDSHLAEVRRRIAEVESGAVKLIPGDEVKAAIARQLDEYRRAS